MLLFTGHSGRWDHMDSLFLGGDAGQCRQLATIIISSKTPKLKGQRFTEMVSGGILIVEDIVGIIMMVLITLAAAPTFPRLS